MDTRRKAPRFVMVRASSVRVEEYDHGTGAGWIAVMGSDGNVVSVSVDDVALTLRLLYDTGVAVASDPRISLVVRGRLTATVTVELDGERIVESRPAPARKISRLFGWRGLAGDFERC